MLLFVMVGLIRHLSLLGQVDIFLKLVNFESVMISQNRSLTSHSSAIPLVDLLL